MKNMGVFEGKALYFLGVGGGWLFFSPVGGCPQKCISVGILCSDGILWVVEI